MTRIGLIAAAAMLAGSFGIAAAQTTTTSPSTSTINAGKCWDSALNQVRDKTAGATSSTGSSGMTGSTTTTGSGTTGTTSTSPGAGSMGGTTTATQTRPAGMPSC